MELRIRSNISIRDSNCKDEGTCKRGSVQLSITWKPNKTSNSKVKQYIKTIYKTLYCYLIQLYFFTITRGEQYILYCLKISPVKST